MRIYPAALGPEERRAVLGELFFEGPELRPYLYRYGTLVALSVAIATFGMTEDSTAVVIGAMLVAPLMTPILAFSAAMVMGWPRRQVASLAIFAAGAAGAVAIAWLLAEVIPGFAFDPLPNEILSRTEPRVLDLGIAVAAGAAGAYVTVRTKGIGALPGTAIAVALVPPLAAVGITLELGEYDLASGAFLLFITNFAAIVLSASIVFMLTGFVPRRRAEMASRRIQWGFATALIAVIALGFLLADHSRNEIREAQNLDLLNQAVDEWIGDRDLRIASVHMTRDGDEVDVTVDLIGPDEPPPAEDLANFVAENGDVDVDLTLGWVKETRKTVKAAPQ